MTTLAGYASELFARWGVRDDGEIMFGRQVAITGLAAQTVTATQLLFGGLAPSKFEGHWLWRPDSATLPTDRARRCTNYTSSTGVLTHAGTAYVDQTVGTERLFICHPDYEPDTIARAIDLAIRSTRKMDRTPIPTRRGQQSYWIGDMTWIQSPDDIPKITLINKPDLGRNGGFEKWNVVNTSGVLQPDDWTIAGASATMARSTTGNREGTYTLAITRAGTDCTVTQTPGLLDNGVSSNNGLIGETVTVWGRVVSSVASQARLFITDSGATPSSYHSGSGVMETLSKTITVASAATTLNFGIAVNNDNAVVYVDKLRLIWTSSVTDTMINDSYDLTEYELPRDSFHYDTSGTLRFFANAPGLGRQYVIHSNRPYSGFDTTRLNAGTADLDSSDAPLETVAAGARYFLLRGKYGDGNAQVESARRDWDQLRGARLYKRPSQTGGFDVRPNRLAVPARRW